MLMIAYYIVMCPHDGHIFGKRSSNTMGRPNGHSTSQTRIRTLKSTIAKIAVLVAAVFQSLRVRPMPHASQQSGVRPVKLSRT